MAETNINKCIGYQFCERDVYADGFCKLHLPFDHDKALKHDDYDNLLLDEIKNAATTAKGLYVLHWEKLNFPKGHVLLNSSKFDEVKDQLAKSWINITDSNIQNISIVMYDIHDLILSGATIHGGTLIPVTNIDRLNMANARFLGSFHCASKSRRIDARDAIFEGEFTFSGSVGELANFTSCRFKKACLFYSATNQMFGGNNRNEFKVAGFNNAIFESPAQTLFQDVDLRKASFKSAPLIGVRFYNTNFYQDRLGRNGLHNEVELLRKIDSTNPQTYVKKYRHLIHEYRQLRMAMENTKDYEKSHDFYVGEMEARQRRKWNLVLAMYCLSSFYGTNYMRAFGVLLCLFFLHFFFTVILSSNFQWQSLTYAPELAATWSQIGDIALHSLSTGTLQRAGLLKDLSSWQSLIDILFRLLIPVQTAMFVLALRNKTKR